MVEFIKKYQTGGLINIDAMRNDMRNDERYYKNGVYTNAGRHHLAALAEIQSNQDKGLRYVINDAEKTFKIVNEQGKDVVDGTGRGIGKTENVTPFYGILNTQKQSKKAVSEIIPISRKYLIQPAAQLEEKGEFIPDSETGEVSLVDDILAQKGESETPAESKKDEAKKEELQPKSEFEYAQQFIGSMSPRAQHMGFSYAAKPQMGGGEYGGGFMGNTGAMPPQQGQTQTPSGQQASSVKLPDTWADYGNRFETRINGLMSASYNPSVGNAGGYKSMVAGGDKIFEQKVASLEEVVRLKRQGMPVKSDIKIAVPTGTNGKTKEKFVKDATLAETQAALAAAKTENFKLYTSQAKSNANAALSYIDKEIARMTNMDWSGNLSEKSAVLGFLQYRRDQIVEAYDKVRRNPNGTTFTEFYGGVDKLPGSGGSYWSSKQQKTVDYATWQQEQRDAEQAKINANYKTPEQIKAEAEKKRLAEIEAKAWDDSYHPVSEHFKDGGMLSKNLMPKAQSGTLNWQNVLDAVSKLPTPISEPIVEVQGVTPSNSLTWESGNMPTIPANYGQSAITPSPTLSPNFTFNANSTGSYSDYKGQTEKQKAKDAEIAAKNQADAEKTKAGELVVNGDAGDLIPSTGGDQQSLDNDIYRQDVLGNPSYKRGPVVSTQGINLSNLQVQYGDLANLFFAWKAKNKKIADIPVLQEKFTPAGSRYVRAAEDMDAGMYNEALNDIAGIRGQYRGSDPVMNMISNHLARAQRSNSTQELISKRAAIRMAERQRVSEEMEQKRQQDSADNLRYTEVENRNAERRNQAEALKAQEKARVESTWWANVNSVIQNMQSRVNQQHAVDQQFETGLRVQEQQNKLGGIKHEIDSYDRQLGMLKASRFDAASQEELDYIDSQIAEIQAAKAKKTEEYTAASQIDYNKARAEAQEIGRGKGLFNFYQNGGKLISR